MLAFLFEVSSDSTINAESILKLLKPSPFYFNFVGWDITTHK